MVENRAKLMERWRELQEKWHTAAFPVSPVTLVDVMAEVRGDATE